MIQLELQFIGLTKRHCPVCGKEVVGRASKVYCSRQCRNKAYHQTNREGLLEKKKAFYHANRGQCLERVKAYYWANRERCIEKDRAYYYANREQRLKKRKLHYQANRERHIEQVEAYRKANPERAKAKEHRRRARKKANGVEPTHEHRTTMVNPLTRQVCYYCGKDCTGDFHWDHFVPISKGGPEAPWNLVVSCPTCNLSKSDKLPESVFCDELGLVT